MLRGSPKLGGIPVLLEPEVLREQPGPVEPQEFRAMQEQLEPRELPEQPFCNGPHSYPDVAQQHSCHICHNYLHADRRVDPVCQPCLELPDVRDELHPLQAGGLCPDPSAALQDHGAGVAARSPSDRPEPEPSQELANATPDLPLSTCASDRDSRFDSVYGYRLSPSAEYHP